MNQPDSARHPRAIAARLAKLNPDQRERLAEKLLERGIDPVSLPIMPRGAADGPLSFGQERLWTLYRLEPESPKYNLFGGATLDGPLDVSALTRSIHWLIERHDVLRTRLIERDGVGVQVIDAPSESAPFEVDYADARGDPFALDDEIERVRAVPFDLTVGPCFRIRLLRVEDERHAMLMAVHHAVADAWSLGIILREIDTAYRAFSTGDTPVTPPLPIQFADYATWERQWQTEAALAPSFAYWRNRLDGVPDAITLPVPSAVRRVDERIGHVVSRTCSSDVGEVLGTFMRDVQLTPYMFFLTVFQLLLHRWSDQRTLCVGSSLAARPRPETESLIGFFVNTIVMRSDFDPSEAAIDFFRRRRDEIVLDLDHRNMPVEQLVAALRPDRARAEHPLFNILFVMQNAPRGDGSLSNVRIEPLTTSTRFARFDLSLRMSQDSDNTFTAGLEYDTGLMDAAMASAILDGVFSLATSVAREPQRSVATVSMTPQSSPAPASQLAPQHWVDAIVDQAARTPMMTALQAKDAACTYADFVGRASRLAAHLRREGFQRQMPVGVLCPRDIDAVVAMFAAVRAGGYFVPLDPGWPSERLNTMVAALGMTWLITDDPEDEWVRASGLRIVSARLGVDVEPHEPSASPAADSELAYVMFTSGSTGRPKGCAITHCNLSHYVAGIVDRLNWAEQSHAAWASTVAADLGYTTVWTTLATGGTLHIYDDEEALLAEPLAARMCAHPVDVMKLAPSHLKALLAQTERPLSILPRRTLILGGEPFDESLRDTLHGIAPTLNLVNHYGPTETTIGVCTGAVRAGAPIALGELLPHVDGYALDAYGMVLPDGLVGEFYVSGASVANGYLNQGGLTAAAFVPHPKAIGERLYRTGDRVRRLDGVWHFVGRLEGFLNVNGYRVEPGEVEAALRAIEGVVDGAVGMSPASGSLQAWVIAAPETSWEPSALDAALRRQLPTHMVPTRWHRVDALPLAANGKLDRSQLCELDEGVSDAQPNAERISPNESRLMSIWCALLSLDAIGLDDNFFALGGDSILGLQMVARARDAGLAMTPKQLFDFPTVRALAKEVAVPQATTASAIQRDRAIDVPLTPIQQWFFALTLAQPAHWNQSLLLTVPESLEPSRLRRSVEKLIEVHDALRLGFDHDGTAWRQDYRAWDTLDLAGCFSVVDIATCDDQGAVAEIERVCERQQASLNLNCPPLFKVVYFDGGPARSGRLFLLAHHLVVDGVSWRIVLDDLRLLYEGREVLAPRASYLDWANAIRTVDTGSSPTPEPPIGPREETFELPCDRVGDNLQSSTQVHTLRLAPALTQVLVSFGGAEPSLSVDDLCISAIAAALHRWTAHRWSSMECEHHGRDGSESQSLDLSRTVGWFTARYLVAIDVAYGERDGEFVRRVARERDRALTDATTRFAARTAARKTGSRAPVPVTFNYLGQVDMGLPSLQWGSAPESGGAQRGPANERPQRLAINALIRDGALQITIIFSEQCHHAETIQAFGDALLAFLDRFVRAIDDESRALEGSSIEADVSLDDRDLGNLLDELRGAD